MDIDGDLEVLFSVVALVAVVVRLIAVEAVLNKIETNGVLFDLVVVSVKLVSEDIIVEVVVDVDVISAVLVFVGIVEDIDLEVDDVVLIKICDD